MCVERVDKISETLVHTSVTYNLNNSQALKLIHLSFKIGHYLYKRGSYGITGVI